MDTCFGKKAWLKNATAKKWYDHRQKIINTVRNSPLFTPDEYSRAAINQVEMRRGTKSLHWLRCEIEKVFFGESRRRKALPRLMLSAGASMLHSHDRSRVGTMAQPNQGSVGVSPTKNSPLPRPCSNRAAVPRWALAPFVRCHVRCVMVLP